MSRPHVVILGAGFGGLAAAKALANRDVDVTVVDRRNHHLFQPLLYQVATAALSPADIAAPVRSILAGARNVRVLLDKVTGIQAGRRRVLLASGAELAYDWLVVATGARHSYFGRDDWAALAPGLKTIEDATAIRHRVLLALERAETETDPARRQALLTFVVIGGGPTGVEMAGAIAELARKSVSRDFRSITPHCSRVLLVEAAPRLLGAFPERLAAKARRAVEQLGVELRLGAPVAGLGRSHVLVGEERIAAHTIVWAAGVQASPAATWLHAPCDRAGRIVVGGDLLVPGEDRVFAIGDTAACLGAAARPLPGIAPVAKQQGRYVARRILGRTAAPFRYRDYGSMATIGRRRAVADFGRVQLAGFPAWLLWCVAHIWFLVGFRSRLSVGLTWAWNYFTFQRAARLITGDIAPDVLTDGAAREAA
ncbi:MAG: NAD(P)/FAD-dependent oxidoreductase [Alphaproteobacteria bacterium]|nr:NAD(P)/FAD-dependent oxidoreductase [Alphaproteobacteria bacterium]